jgi:hypothetical protein
MATENNRAAPRQAPQGGILDARGRFSAQTGRRSSHARAAGERAIWAEDLSIDERGGLGIDLIQKMLCQYQEMLEAAVNRGLSQYDIEKLTKALDAELDELIKNKLSHAPLGSCPPRISPASGALAGAGRTRGAVSQSIEDLVENVDVRAEGVINRSAYFKQDLVLGMLASGDFLPLVSPTVLRLIHRCVSAHSSIASSSSVTIGGIPAHLPM